ncbi:DNA binding domain-containing protein, excisionase family [Paenibacillus sp. 1_12]|uniref:helix-turn-helix domain-containing protein n=1 Tax=Paenibacillus sp. 1_12 TaxID=1566278 RepID=UPI0008EA5DE2|nr:helix-turn-helix domain-containing protein [Paenibacillus sp. 1_12]SFK76273.1 DNA binding domain-containing protein, excisionase family [Paenibacillus sp. 1_12]
MFAQYDDIVNIEDCCEMLNIGRNKAYELLQTGQIKSFKVGGKAYRIPKVCIQEFVLAQVQIEIDQYRKKIE